MWRPHISLVVSVSDLPRIGVPAPSGIRAEESRVGRGGRAVLARWLTSFPGAVGAGEKSIARRCDRGQSVRMSHSIGDTAWLGPWIDVTDLFAPQQEALTGLLRELTDEEWQRPTACPGWSVHATAAHVLGGQLNRLARGGQLHPHRALPVRASPSRVSSTGSTRSGGVPREAGAHGGWWTCSTTSATRPSPTGAASTWMPWASRSPGRGPARRPSGWTRRGSTPSTGPASSRAVTPPTGRDSSSQRSSSRCWTRSCARWRTRCEQCRHPGEHYCASP
ncbi:maleylpyruvate isomerase N-terminal domain-containing protein [Salinactinospora qingdaonensis]|uniref:maleylpyruvate isomerase N-terminal domain-containing protein n=1 Tax=Salinactinospora qingdaonensis TaxID=702744 RepID=UPI003CD0571A